MRDRPAVQLARGAVFGQVNFQKATVAAGESIEGVQRFADAGAFGPATADAGGQGDDRDFAAADGGFAQVHIFRFDSVAQIDHVRGTDIIDGGILESRFCDRPMRPLSKSVRICSCWFRSKPFSAKICCSDDSCVWSV